MSAAKKHEPESESRVKGAAALGCRGKGGAAVNLERVALNAVALDDGDIGLDTLRAVSNDIHVLYCALTNDRGRPDDKDIAAYVAQVRWRIELALALALAAESEVAP